MKIKKITTILMVSIVITCPISVYGSTQTDGEGEGATIGDVLYESPDLVNEVQSIWQKISSGNIEGAIEGILGAIGLLNPAHESARISSGEDGDNPYANPETPEEVYDLEQHTDVVRSQIPQKLSQVVFSTSGQEAMAERTAQVQEIQQVSNEAQQAASVVVSESDQVAQTSTTHADNIQALGESAQSADASQDVLKALAAQNQDFAQIIAGNANQLANLGEIATYQSVQLSGINGQLTALNETGQVTQVLLASQNYLLSQVDDALDRQQEYQQEKDSLKDGLNRDLSQMVYIPGLFNGDAGNE